MDFNKKEMPIQGYTGFGGGATSAAFRGAGVDKTYVEDVFSTYVYTGTGTGSVNTINNGIDLSGEGGMVWIKNREGGASHAIWDTVRGAGNTTSGTNAKALPSNGDQVEGSIGGSIEYLSAFNDNGFSLAAQNIGPHNCNGSGVDFASWTLRKTAGLFDIKTWDGNGSAGRQISHDLGCVPGMIFVRSLNNSGDWMVYHRDIGNEYRLKLNSDTNKGSGTASWNDTTPTSTYVTLGSNTGVNASGTSYVGYFFAGGDSTASTACSVHFDGSNDYLYTSTSHSDISFGTGNFTIELWFRYDGSDLASTNDTLIDTRNGDSGGTADHGWTLFVRNNGKLALFTNGADGNGYAVESNVTIDEGQWYHAAITRDGNTYRLFLNGTLNDVNTQSTTADAGSNFYIGYKANYSASSLTYWNGLISNVRILKGTALYTASFRTPTEPLTNITNTKFLWAQSSTVTTGTVNPMTLTNSGTTATTDSPFDDPAAFVFGADGDESIVKCSSYIGNGSATRPEIYLGWEPQWILIKNATNANNWYIWDSIRGWVTHGDSQYIFPNEATAAGSAGEGAADGIDRLPDGFNTRFSGGGMNADGDRYVYWAVRRPDGYVGKAPAAATDVYAQDTGNGSTDGPTFDSGFPVDFSLRRMPTGGASVGAVNALFVAYERILGLNYLQTANTSAESTSSRAKYDLMTGANHTDNSTYQAWLWKRNYGFDVIAYRGYGTDLTPRSIPHSLAREPEMIWVKNRDSSVDWMVWHKDLNGGGSNAVNYNLRLNQTDAQNANGDIFGGANNVLPTSTHWTVGGNSGINESGSDFVALLFASVSGISKCGSYTGDDTDDGSHVIDVGFAPRILIIKRTDSGADWQMFNTLTGFPTSGASAFMEFNTSDDAYSGSTATVTKTSSGFKLWSPGAPYNANNGKYIYYAHA